MSDLEVDPATLRAASSAWAEQADQLRGAVASLEEITSIAVGPRPSSALSAFRRHWSDRLGSLQQDAQDHAAAISAAADLTLTVDDERAAAIAGLLPHGS